MRQLAIGIAGTAKNTGKTTTLNALYEALAGDATLNMALTSIGYDGESFDNVTGLPKPRVTVRAGMYAAVAKRCLAYSRAQMEVLEDTGIQTAMGNILIGRVSKPGKLIISGPNKRKDLRTVLDRLKAHGANLTLVDGALGRILPFVEMDGIILATGAARFADINRLAGDTHAMLSLLSTPVLPAGSPALMADSLLTDAAYEALLTRAQTAQTLTFSGVVMQKYLAKMAREPRLKGKRVLLSDPLKLLLAGMPQETLGALEALRGLPAEVGVERSIRVLGLTINPYYPRYRINREDYEPAYVDRERLFEALSAVSGVPCHDIVRQGVTALADSVTALIKQQA